MPDPTYVPPHEPEYHAQLVALFKVPDVTLNVVLPPHVIEVADADTVGVVGLTAVGAAFITEPLLLTLPSQNAR